MARSKVAEAVRQARIDEEQAMTPAERVKLARELGERGIAMYMAIHGVDRETAIRAIEKEHQAGRRYSRCMDDDAR